ncbi:hypothetical protein PMAYCL1PPCAC_03742, partial [Pristionchus mayeri]
LQCLRMGLRRGEQVEELEGFLSMLECFDGSLDFEQPENALIHGKIRIDLPMLEKPVVVFAEVGDEVQFRTVQALEYCTLLFSLPDAYPSVPPSIDVECAWMSEKKVEQVQHIIRETAASYEDQPMLYAIAFAVREKACENLEKSIRVDNTPYCVAKGIDGSTILHRLVEAGAAIEQAAFERECHDCEVCYENEPGTRCVRFLPCRHVYCARCVQQYFVGLLKSEGIRTFECLADACSSIAAQDVVKKAIGEEEYERYETILLERALGAMEDMAICPREICGKYVVINPMNRQLGRCDACAYAFCIICRKTYHGVEGCRWQIDEKLKLLEEYDKGDNRTDLAKRVGGEAALERMISTLRNDKWVLENSKKCPKCKADIEKNNGCNKMKCCKCSTVFCWLCLKRLDIGDPYKHFSETNGTCANRLFEGMDEDDDENAFFFDGDLDDDDDDGDDFDDFYDYEAEGEFDIDDLYDDPERLLEMMADHDGAYFQLYRDHEYLENMVRGDVWPGEFEDEDAVEDPGADVDGNYDVNAPYEDFETEDYAGEDAETTDSDEDGGGGEEEEDDAADDEEAEDDEAEDDADEGAEAADFDEDGGAEAAEVDAGDGVEEAAEFDDYGGAEEEGEDYYDDAEDDDGEEYW